MKTILVVMRAVSVPVLIASLFMKDYLTRKLHTVQDITTVLMNGMVMFAKVEEGLQPVERL